MTSAARRASPASSFEQQPREPAAQRVRCLRQGQVHADDVVPGVVGRARPRPRSRRRRSWRPVPSPRPCARPPAPARRPGRSRPSPARRRAGVEVCPRENRSDPRAVASSAPIASSTWLGWATPAVHAEPVEHSMPWASSSMSSESPSQPGKDRWALPGSRDGPPSMTPVPGSPFSTASGHARAGSCRRGRRAARPSRAARCGACATASSTAWPGRRPPGVSSVPERTSRSWPPPCSSGVHRHLAASSSAPAPYGPPSLCPVRVSASTPDAAKSTGRMPDRLHGVGVQRHPVPVRDGGQLADRVDRADLVVGPHHRHHGDGRRVVGDRGVQRSRAAPARRGPPRARSTCAPSCSASHRAESSTAWCSIAETSTRLRRGVGGPARPVEALDGEVVALGAAGGEHDLRRAGARPPRRSAPGTPRPRGARGGPRCAATRRCRCGRAPRPSPPPPASSMGVVAAWSR